MMMASEKGEGLDLGMWAPTRAREGLGGGGWPGLSGPEGGEMHPSKRLLLEFLTDPPPGGVQAERQEVSGPPRSSVTGSSPPEGRGGNLEFLLRQKLLCDSGLSLPPVR